MNIWILNHYAGAADQQATRSYDLGRELVRRGHQVTIFASSFSHYRHVEERLHAGEPFKSEMADGVRFLWLKTRPYQRNDLNRVLNVLGYCWRAWRVGAALDERPDLIIGTCMHPLAPLVAYRLARRKNARFVYEVTDLWPQSLVDLGVLSEGHPITYLLRRLERFLFERAERIIALLPYVGEYVESIGVPAGKVVWIPNGVDIERYSVDAPAARANDIFTVTYVGGFSTYHGLDVAVDAATQLAAEGAAVRFMFYGSGVDKARIIALAQSRGLANMHFHDPIPKSDVQRVLATADALLFTCRELPVHKYGMSSVKIADYLCAGRPILYAASARNNPVEEAHAGCVVKPEDADGLARGIRELMAMSASRRAVLGRNGREYVERTLDTRVLARRLEAVLAIQPRPAC